MGQRPFTLIAAVIFGLMALAHAYRLLTHFQVIVGNHMIAQAVSWVAVIFTAVLSYGLLREARR
jgi:tellurite resistance protein TehA-like permease